MSLKSVCALLVAGSLFPPAAFAATPPDAGSIYREQQPMRILPPESSGRPDETVPEIKVPVGISVMVRGFDFTGYQGVATEAELQGIVSRAIGKSLSFKDLQQIADEVTTYLKSKGWLLARAYLPKQDVTDGIVTIAVIAGKSDGTIVLEPDSTVRIQPEILRDMLDNAVSEGEPIDENRLEGALLRINDLPGISARVVLMPGSLPETSTIRVPVSEGPVFSGALWTDNQGNRYSGLIRGNALLMVNDPFRFGDQLSSLVTFSSGLTQGRLAYGLPLGSSGLRGLVSWTGMKYELGEELEDLHYHGDSNVIDAGLSYPVLRSRRSNVNARMTYSYKTFSDMKDRTELYDKSENSVTVGLSGDRYDAMFGGGITSWSASFTNGALHEHNPLALQQALKGKIEGSYTIANLAVARLQRLHPRVTFNLSWSGQLTADNLGSSGKFNLGGPNGVRAYPVGEASGARGQLINADIRYLLPLPSSWGTFQISGFYDAGQITQFMQRYSGDVSTATGRNTYWLSGAGVGLNCVVSQSFSLRGSWAHTIGDNPGRSTAGMNSDGKDDDSRFWLQMMINF